MDNAWRWLADAWDVSAVFLAGALVLGGAVTGWLANLFSLPGNWLIVLVAAIAMVAAPTGTGEPLIGWAGLLTLAGLAVVGEIVEFAAGAAGAAKKGASKRAIWLSVGGAMAGSIAGAMTGVPVPVLGPLIGAVLGGGAGAFGGAYLGEAWIGTAQRDRVSISLAAFVGRLLGTAGKLLVGAVMVVCVCVAMAV